MPMIDGDPAGPALSSAMIHCISKKHADLAGILLKPPKPIPAPEPGAGLRHRDAPSHIRMDASLPSQGQVDS
jgi:hypothetical protein